MDVSDKVNGELTDQINDSPPKLQRKLKINRRSYHLANSPTKCLSTDTSDEKNSSINGSDGTIDKMSKVDSTQKRIISLSSIKNSSGSDKNHSVKEKDSSSIIILKKTPITFTEDKKENPINTVTSSSSDPPPKKKHKPITWP